MTSEQQQVKSWMQAFGQETPKKPIIPEIEIRKLRAKLCLTECLELLVDGLGVEFLVGKDDTVISIDLRQLLNDLENNKYNYNAGGTPNLIEIADGCEDLKVVTEGTLVACGLLDQSFKCSPGGEVTEEDPLFDEVMRSNWTKFWTHEEKEREQNKTTQWLEFTYIDGGRWLAKDSNGKVIKSPSYSPPNLEPIIEEMSKC